MEQYIPKSAIIAKVKIRRKEWSSGNSTEAKYKSEECDDILSIISNLEVKEVDIDKLCEFRENIGFAYPEGASEYQKQLACYRQGIKDVIKALKEE